MIKRHDKNPVGHIPGPTLIVTKSHGTKITSDMVVVDLLDTYAKVNDLPGTLTSLQYI